MSDDDEKTFYMEHMQLTQNICVLLYHHILDIGEIGFAVETYRWDSRVPIDCY